MYTITKRAAFFFNKLDYYSKRCTSLLKNKAYRAWKIYVAELKIQNAPKIEQPQFEEIQSSMIE